MTRRDLTPEMQAVQAVHAACEAVHHLFDSTTGLHTVLLSVENERELIKTMQHLNENGVRYCHFIDSDLNNEITSLASEPVFDMRKVFKNFQLLKFKEVKGV